MCTEMQILFSYKLKAKNALLYLDVWYCSEQCRSNNNTNKILKHSMRLLYECLCHLARRDMVREGDGLAVLSMWKINMFKFYKNNHTHYKTIGYNFLACEYSRLKI